jgi:hypothetical protein
MHPTMRNYTQTQQNGPVKLLLFNCKVCKLIMPDKAVKVPARRTLKKTRHHRHTKRQADKTTSLWSKFKEHGMWRHAKHTEADLSTGYCSNTRSACPSCPTRPPMCLLHKQNRQHTIFATLSARKAHAISTDRSTECSDTQKHSQSGPANWLLLNRKSSKPIMPDKAAMLPARHTQQRACHHRHTKRSKTPTDSRKNATRYATIHKRQPRRTCQLVVVQIQGYHASHARQGRQGACSTQTKQKAQYHYSERQKGTIDLTLVDRPWQGMWRYTKQIHNRSGPACWLLSNSRSSMSTIPAKSAKVPARHNKKLAIITTRSAR